MVTLAWRNSTFNNRRTCDEGDKYVCFGGGGGASDNLRGAGSAAARASAAIAAGARDDVLRHWRWARQGRRSRWNRRSGPILSDARGAPRRERKNLARLSQQPTRRWQT